MKNKRGIAIGTVVVLIAVGLGIWLGVFPPWGGAPAEEIAIGVITPLTGEGATYGEATKKALDLAMEEINAAGGINGQKIRLIYEDSQLKPEPATNAIQKLTTVDKVPIIIGAFGSSVTLAVAPIAERNKVVLFSASSTADVIKDAGDYIFRNVPPNAGQGNTAAEFAYNKLNARTAAIFNMNNDYGISLAAAFETAFKRLGGTILIEETHNQGDRDFRTQLTKIRETTPEVIFYPGHYQESGLILKQATELGVEATFIGGDGSYSPELINIAGNAAEGSCYTLMGMGYGVSDPEIDAFVKAFKRKYGEEPGVYSAYAYDALGVISEAIEDGGYTAEGVKGALYKITDFKGVTGITHFDRFGEVDKPYAIYEVREGAFVLYGTAP